MVNTTDIKKTATFEEYVINKKSNNSVAVFKDGILCENTKAGLRDIAARAGFIYEDKWTTQQLGSKIIDFLNANTSNSSQPCAQDEEVCKPSISITPDTFICDIYDKFYEVYPYIHLRILMDGKDMFDASDDVDPTLTLAECGPTELMNYDTRKKNGTISIDSNRPLGELIADFNQYGLNTYVYYIDGEYLELCRTFPEFDDNTLLGDINEVCESMECPPYKVGDEWPCYDEEEEYYYEDDEEEDA